MKLKNMVAIVTGSSRGIGRHIATEFAKEGCSVAINYLSNESDANDTKEAITSQGSRAIVVQADVSQRQEVQRLFSNTIDSFGRIDILVNNAGVLQQKPFEQITDSEWDWMLSVCLKGPFICAQEVLPYFKKQHSGRIINIASMGGQFGGAKAPHYSAAKAGLISLTKSTARIMAEYSVNVNCISPGFVRTDMSEHEINQLGGIESAGKGIPLGHVGEPSDIARAAVFLASEDSRYVTGATLNVNGGLHMF